MYGRTTEVSEKPIEASESELKAISAENRRKMLLSLKERRKTLSELSQVLGIKPSSAKQHLEILESCGFVAQMDEGRKWKYYELTDKGRRLFLFKERSISVLLVFASAAIAMMFAVYIFMSLSPGAALSSARTEASNALTEQQQAPKAVTSGAEASSSAGSADKSQKEFGTPPPLPLPEPKRPNPLFIGGAIMVVAGACFALGYLAFRMRKKEEFCL